MGGNSSTDVGHSFPIFPTSRIKRGASPFTGTRVGAGSSGSAEGDACILPAKATRIGQGITNVPLARLIGSVVQRARRIGGLVIRGGWGDLVPQGHDGKDRLDRPRPA